MSVAPTSGAVARDGFEIQRRLRGAVHYNRWIYETLAPYVGRRVVDLGSGAGNITRQLLDRELVVAAEREDDFLAVLRSLFAGRPNVVVEPIDLATDQILRLKKYRLDTATCLNVMEHLEDDAGFIRRVARVLVPGGRLLLVVPALPALFGSMDRTDGHYRRYLKGTLGGAVRRGGLEVEALRYMNLPGIAGWFLNARVLQRKVLPERQLLLYDRVVPIVKRLEAVLPPWVGQSLFCSARKRGV